MISSRGIEYSEISHAKITNERDIVFSKCSKGGYTIAQRMKVTENNHTNSLYLKGAIHIHDIGDFYELRDAIGLAILKLESESIETDNWDE